MRINVKDSTMVKPMAAAPSRSLWISDLDLLMEPNYHTRFLYFYRSGEGATFLDSTVLKAALSRALVYFYPVAGRMKKDDNGRVEINCNGEGVVFVEAECDGAIDDIGTNFVPTPDLTLIPPVDYSQQISTIPLLLLQITGFKSCGGVCLGIAISHYVSDGLSANHFINTWADIARGREVAVPPFIDRTLLRGRHPPQPQFNHVEYQPYPTMKISDDETSIFSIFKLTPDQVNALKAYCGEDLVDGNRVCEYSTFEVVAGHVWRCTSMARGLPKDQETKLYIPVDGRSRLQPPLPPGYFGNVIFTATPIASGGEMQSNPLKFAVRKIHDALAKMKDTRYLRSALDHLELQPDIMAMARGRRTYRCPNLCITSWIRLPADADFGCGKAVHLGPGGPTCEGKCVVMRSPGKEGSLLCAISLLKPHMRIFERLFYEGF